MTRTVVVFFGAVIIKGKRKRKKKDCRHWDRRSVANEKIKQDEKERKARVISYNRMNLEREL